MTGIAKAILAALTSAATWGVTAGSDGTYDQVELWGLLGALAAALTVYLVPNTAPASRAPDPNRSEVGPGDGRHERGAVNPVVALLVAILVVLLLIWLGVSIDL